jgi:hypothetical protein
MPLQVRGVFDEMLATGLTPSIVAFNSLLASYAALGAWGEALDTLTHVMAAQVEGVNPNTCEAGRGGGGRGEGRGRALLAAEEISKGSALWPRACCSWNSELMRSSLPPPPPHACSHLQRLPGRHGQGRPHHPRTPARIRSLQGAAGEGGEWAGRGW